MSDSLWFLENLDETESKDSEKEKSEGSEKREITPIPELDGSTLDYNQDSDLRYFDQQSNQGNELASLESNQIEKSQAKGSMENEKLESSILESPIDSNNELDIPEIKIKINVENLKKLLEDPLRGSMPENSFTVEQTSQPSEVATQPKMYVILKDNRAPSGTGDQEKKVYTEVGSTVINLNDLDNTNNKIISGDEEITTAVNSVKTDGNNGNKVELVITVKDLRKNKSGKHERQRNSQRNDPFNPYVDSTLPRYKGRNENAYDSYETWETTKYSGQYGNECTEETRDSYIRETDGARCYRTVTTTPQGRRVKTECYRGEKSRRRPENDRFNRYQSYGRNGSFWQEIDDEFNRMFSSARRFFIF